MTTNQDHQFIQLAIDSVSHFFEHGERMACPENLPEPLQKKAGAFVTLRKGDKLRGCIGALTPQTGNLAQEIIKNAVEAAFCDPRFNPVKKKEVNELSFAVEVILPPEKVTIPDELDPEVFGLLFRSNKKQGALLPGLDGVHSTEEQIRICRLKGRIKDQEPQEFFRFRVESYC